MTEKLCRVCGHGVEYGKLSLKENGEFEHWFDTHCVTALRENAPPAVYLRFVVDRIRDRCESCLVDPYCSNGERLLIEDITAYLEA